jgi:hypothetical protein
MRVEENEASGESVLLGAGDSLDDIPKSHSHLLTAPLIEAFADPIAYFANIAARCPFPEMKRWILALVAKPRWELRLHLDCESEWGTAGYYWSSKVVRSATIGLPVEPIGDFPNAIQCYYTLVDFVDWMGFGCLGGLSSASDQPSLADTYQLDYTRASIDPTTAFVCGVSPCGNVLIWTPDDVGGWVDHETGNIKIIGTIEATINSVYRTLNANKCPDIEIDC